MTIIEISASLRLRGLPWELAEVFVRENTFENPEYAKRQRMDLWAEKVPPLIKLFQRERDSLVLPRGYFPRVVSALRNAGVRFEVTDHTVCPLAKFSAPLGELYPYQKQALNDLLRWDTGVLEAPPGSGKTNMLLSAIPRLQTNTLILVHTKELQRQTVERVGTWLGIEAGVIGGGHREKIQPITVAMIQTLAKRNLKESGIADYFGAVMVDEAHHSPATTWARVLEQLPAKFKCGFTATAWRKDQLHFLLWRLIGNKVKVPRQVVEAEGRIVRPDVEVVQTNYYYPPPRCCRVDKYDYRLGSGSRAQSTNRAGSEASGEGGQSSLDPDRQN